MKATPGSSRQLTIVRLLVHIRRKILVIAICFPVLTAVIYVFSPWILRQLQHHLGQKLAFFGVMEPVLALLKLSGLIAIAALMPFVLWQIFQGIEATIGLSRKTSFILFAASLILFFTGAAFCYLVTLSFGIRFLLGFQSEYIHPVISLGRFVDFVVFFVAGFGLIFELPLVIPLICRLGICRSESLSRGRRYAVLVIAVLSALLTPTPDLLNMSLMAIPMYLLYELGILLAKVFGRSCQTTAT